MTELIVALLVLSTIEPEASDWNKIDDQSAPEWASA